MTSYITDVRTDVIDRNLVITIHNDRVEGEHREKTPERLQLVLLEDHKGGIIHKIEKNNYTGRKEVQRRRRNRG